MRRIATVLTVIALTPLLMGAGGMNPPAFEAKATGPAVSAVVVMDPHMAAGDPGNQTGMDITTTAKQASIRLHKGTLASGAVFKVASGFALFRGCDLNLTDTRFVYSVANPTTLSAWIPQQVIDEIFLQVGITVTATNIPAITDVDNAVCTNDPFNPGPIADGGDGQPSAPGLLSFEAVIQFLVPK